MCRCNICGPVSRNEADFDVSIGREDRLLRVCRWCSQDLTLFGVKVNQKVGLPRVRIPLNLLAAVMGPVYGFWEAKKK
jgi:heme oxygenase